MAINGENEFSNANRMVGLLNEREWHVVTYEIGRENLSMFLSQNKLLYLLIICCYYEEEEYAEIVAIWRRWRRKTHIYILSEEYSILLYSFFFLEHCGLL
jgi:hypothetical protein